ncbi:hypothetical protein [Anaerobium acetethylicum]|uniref:Uncharacterized protein n=1 Tax=Anaerobium acetethylicum TaxID=1619234 RepID=A0A1D3TNF5_9FIRM|nr:hypothetical protein [Anaerobium acetethylicum]SCP94817.1 hypothetical protein SAMN05421730_100172 [Anaerobium acetethylicum]
MDDEIRSFVKDVISCSTIMRCADQLVKFADRILYTGNCAEILDYFYEELYMQFLKYERPLEFVVKGERNPRYRVVGEDAMGWILAKSIPHFSTPEDTLKAIKLSGQKMLAEFSEEDGEIIKPADIRYIMDILDREHDFSKQVFCDSPATICIINAKHKNSYGFQTVHRYYQGRINICIWLYQIYGGGQDYEVNCESVFLHELGHALLTRFCENAPAHIPEELIPVLASSYPGFATISEHDKIEGFVEMLVVGMMSGTELEKYNPFEKIKPDIQKRCCDMFQHVIQEIKEQNMQKLIKGRNRN